MKIIQTIYTGHNWHTGEDNEDRRVEVSIEDENGRILESVSFAEGEPEDMTLYRDLNDAYSIIDLVEKAYELGKQGIDVKFEYLTEEY